MDLKSIFLLFVYLKKRTFWSRTSIILAQPWYKKSKIYTVEDNRDIEVDLKRKIVDDPLTNINLKLNEKNKKKKKSHKNDRDKDHSKKKKSEPTKSDLPIKKTKTIEELRAERYFNFN